MLDLQSISHTYGVYDVSVSVAPGELVGVIGPNGAGKSTLAQAALGLLSTQGTVSVDGADLRALPVIERAKRIAAVLQGEAAAFPFSARQLVALGLHAQRPADGERIVDEAMRQAGALDLAERRLDTLSGGERQRVFVARALAQQTRYLVLDEPTTFFDIAHEIAFAQLLRGLKDKGILWILHDPGLALRYCDRVLLLHQGRTVAFGAAAEVLTPARLTEVFSVRAELLKDSAGAPHLVFI